MSSPRPVITKSMMMMRTPPRAPSLSDCDSQVVVFHHETPPRPPKVSRAREPELFVSPLLSPVVVTEVSPPPPPANTTPVTKPRFIPFRPRPFRAAEYHKFLNSKRF